MSRKIAAAIAGAFAAGVFVAAAPSVTGHGPDAGWGHAGMWENGWGDAMPEACDQDEAFERMFGGGGHMSGVGADWMTDMMFDGRGVR